MTTTTDQTSDRSPSSAPRPPRVPGDPSAWVLLLGDMVLFTALFTVFLAYRQGRPAVFATGRDALHVNLGLLNTVVLIVSSLLVVYGLEGLRAGEVDRARRLLGGAVGCAVVFAAVKAVEWTAAVTAGHTLTADLFFTMYFALTGLHLLHVIVGAVALVAITSGARRCRPGTRAFTYAETGACFWHMVDLIWLVLFPLLYLIG